MNSVFISHLSITLKRTFESLALVSRTNAGRIFIKSLAASICLCKLWGVSVPLVN